MIVYSNVLYQVEKKRFGWYRVYEDGFLHAKFKYKASAVHYAMQKWDNEIKKINQLIQEGKTNEWKL